MSDASVTQPARSHSPRTETATVLFTDLVGSTELRQKLGDDAADELRRDHDELLRDAIAAHAGTEVKGLGDGLMVVFDSAADGVAAAVAMQRAMHRLAQRTQGSVQIRVGLSAGDVSWEEADCFGSPVVEAKRLCDAAAGEHILAAEVVRILAGTRGGHQFVAAGPFELKGLDGLVAACEVTWEPSPVVVPLPPSLAVVEAVPFVGRDVEFETLTFAWRRATAGERRVVLLAGEPGIGKTRLAFEVGRAAHDGGGVVMFGRCDEDLGVPFQPFVEALRDYAVSCAADELRLMLGPDAGELVRLVPELSGRVGDVPAVPSSDPETERYRLFEAVARLLARVSQASPVMLVLDDVHWAARPTLLMLRHVLRSTDPMALLIVGTYRDTELGRSHPLAEMLADLRRDDSVERIPVGGLARGAVAELAEAIGPSSVDVGAVYAESDGNPFFAGQLLRHLGESGPGDGRIPEGVREVVGRRLARLSVAANEALAIGAVMGREFELTVIEACGGPSGDGLVAALDEALRARIVDEAPGSVGRYSFAHALIRQTLYDELSLTRRVRLHWRIGEAVEARPGPDADARLPELAHHFVTGVLAGDAHRAAAIAVRAGDRSGALFAHEDAAGLYRQATGLLDTVSDSDPDLRFRTLTGLGWALYALGDISGGVSAFLDAASLARETLSAQHLARAVIGYTGTFRVDRTDVSVEALVSEAIAGLAGVDSPELSQLLARKSVLLRDEGRSADAESLLAQALDMARRLGDKPALATTLESRAAQLLQTPRIDEALAILDELDALGENQWQLVNMRTLALLFTGDRAGVDSGLAEFRRFVDQQGTAPIVRNALNADGGIALAEGRWADAKALAAVARDRLPNDVAAQLAAGALVTIARREQGRAAELVEPTAQAVTEYGLRPWASLLATMHCDIGDMDAALAVVESFANDGFADVTTGSTGSESLVLHHLAEATAFLRNVTVAAGLYDLVLPYSGLLLNYFDISVVVGAADRAIGQLATVLGRYDEAEERYKCALALERNFGARALVPRTQYWYARMLVERDPTGDRQRAKALLGECLLTTAELGMAILERQAREVAATV